MDRTLDTATIEVSLSVIQARLRDADVYNDANQILDRGNDLLMNPEASRLSKFKYNTPFQPSALRGPAPEIQTGLTDFFTALWKLAGEVEYVYHVLVEEYAPQFVIFDGKIYFVGNPSEA